MQTSPALFCVKGDGGVSWKIKRGGLVNTKDISSTSPQKKYEATVLMDGD